MPHRRKLADRLLEQNRAELARPERRRLLGEPGLEKLHERLFGPGVDTVTQTGREIVQGEAILFRGVLPGALKITPRDQRLRLTVLELQPAKVATLRIPPPLRAEPLGRMVTSRVRAENALVRARGTPAISNTGRACRCRLRSRNPGRQAPVQELTV